MNKGILLRLRLSSSGPRGRALVAALVLLSVLLPVWWVADLRYSDWETDENRAHVAAQLSPYTNIAATSVNQHLGLLRSLETIVALKVRNRSLRPDDVEEIDDFVEEAIAQAGGVRSFAMVPNGVRSHVYPGTGGESAIASDLLHSAPPEVQADVQRAIASGQATVSGPFSMGSRDLILVGWQP